jgi:acetyltransferase-like isoleucine patch superfamily enzyme
VTRTLPDDWFPRPLPSSLVLGDGSWLYSAFAFIHCRSRRPCAVAVGRRSGIYIGSLFELGPNAEVTIGDYCTFVGVIVATNGRVRVGDYCFFAHEVVIADTPFARPPPDSDDETAAGGEPETCVEIGDDVWVGTGAVILKGARIGRGAIIGAAAVVDFEVPDYAVVAGNPAAVVGYAHPRR